MNSGMEYFLKEVRELTNQKPPFNDAFVSRALYMLHQSVHVVIGLSEMIKSKDVQLEETSKSVSRAAAGKISWDVVLHSKKNRDEEMVQDYKSGMRKKDIAIKHGISGARVHVLLKKLGCGPKRYEDF